MQNEGHKKGGIFRLILSLLFLFGAAWLFLNKQWVLDNYVVWQYQPTSEVASLVSDSFMTKKSEFYFYASKPEINDRATFNTNCTSNDEQTVVLGCYASQRIYIFDVDDERLDGIKQVTAAHEMLHAVYERLSTAEKERVNLMIEAQLKSVTDQRIQKLIAAYARTEPSEKLNELHSIFATELSPLSTDLEQYYSQYFTDRAAIVKTSQQYQEVFISIEAQQDALIEELNTLATTIKTDGENYNRSIEQFNQDVASFNTKANNGGYTSSQAFNADRDALMRRQESLQTLKVTIDTNIALYDKKMIELENINGQAEQLNQSIDSTTLAPASSL